MKLVFLFLVVGLAPVYADTDLAKDAQRILKTNCATCHGGTEYGPDANKGGIDYILSREKLVKQGYIVPNDPDNSPLLKKVESGAMPPEKVVEPRPKKEEMEILRDWIKAGAPVADLKTKRPVKTAIARVNFLNPNEVENAIATDLNTLEAKNQPHVRYFSLTNIFNAGANDKQLDFYRHGLTKLLNSLSRAPEVVVPAEVDAEKTIYRIDLRQYGWDEKTWNQILNQYPYGYYRENDTMKSIQDLTAAKLPIVRGDWFLAAASRPPLYHDLLKLPKTERQLEQQLGIDTAKNIDEAGKNPHSRKAARVGLSKSDVHKFGRILERHETTYGQYWKTFDFASGGAKKDPLKNPIGPSRTLHQNPNAFAQDSSEIMFSLPNGFLAFMVVDAAGNRVDKGQAINTAAPVGRNRKEVSAFAGMPAETGVSCMSCHTQGVQPRLDETRAYLQRNFQQFSPDEALLIQNLYADDSRLRELLEKDRASFVSAMGKANVPFEFDKKIIDPISVAERRYVDTLDLNAVAAEFGLKPGQFETKLSNAELGLSKVFDSLKEEGGTIKRDELVSVFKETVEKLKLGVFASDDKKETE